MKNYTICLIGQHIGEAIVVGGGNVAARKVRGLLAAGAHVTVISPALIPELQALADAGELSVIPRPYQPGDLTGASLVIAATDNLSVNQAVWDEARQRHCLVNVVDDPEHSTFIMPAVVRRGDLSIAVSTAGASPALARCLRQRLERLIGPEYAVLTEILRELRPELLTRFPSGDARLRAALRIIDSRILRIIQTHGKEVALTYAREQMQQG